MFLLRSRLSFPAGARPHATRYEPLRALPLLRDVQARGQFHYSPSRKCPRAFSGRNLSQMIFRIASNGTAKIAPGTPHIQNQNTSDKMTRTGFSVKRRASNMGVAASPVSPRSVSKRDHERPSGNVRAQSALPSTAYMTRHSIPSSARARNSKATSER
jgi:hypothetical protein